MTNLDFLICFFLERGVDQLRGWHRFSILDNRQNKLFLPTEYYEQSSPLKL